MIAWHYTTGDKARAIMASGFIRPANALIPDREKPVVWFSTAAHYEPTAHKGMINVRTGEARLMTLAEMHAAGAGLFRFGTDARNLLCGEALARKARIGRPTWAHLRKCGISMGADPLQWFGHVGAWPIDGMVIEHMPSMDRGWTPYAVEVAA